MDAFSACGRGFGPSKKGGTVPVGIVPPFELGMVRLRTGECVGRGRSVGLRGGLFEAAGGGCVFHWRDADGVEVGRKLGGVELNGCVDVGVRGVDDGSGRRIRASREQAGEEPGESERGQFNETVGGTSGVLGRHGEGLLARRAIRMKISSGYLKRQ
jgi:hypothetical protein